MSAKKPIKAIRVISKPTLLSKIKLPAGHGKTFLYSIIVTILSLVSVKIVHTPTTSKSTEAAEVTTAVVDKDVVSFKLAAPVKKSPVVAPVVAPVAAPVVDPMMHELQAQIQSLQQGLQQVQNLQGEIQALHNKYTDLNEKIMKINPNLYWVSTNAPPPHPVAPPPPPLPTAMMGSTALGSRFAPQAPALSVLPPLQALFSGICPHCKAPYAQLAALGNYSGGRTVDGGNISEVRYTFIHPQCNGQFTTLIEQFVPNVAAVRTQ